MIKIWKDIRVTIRTGWKDAGREGMALGEPVKFEQDWLPVKWDDADDPDFFKLAGLEKSSRIVYPRLPEFEGTGKDEQKLLGLARKYAFHYDGPTSARARQMAHAAYELGRKVPRG